MFYHTSVTCTSVKFIKCYNNMEIQIPIDRDIGKETEYKISQNK